MSENTEVAIVENFDGIAFLSKIENAETTQKKVSILNDALNQEPLMVKNMKQEMAKKGYTGGGNANDYNYIPIFIIEEALRQIFFRQVDFIIRQSFRDLNSFVVVARIRYKCPISLEYRIVDGIGAENLQQDSGAKVQDFNLTMKSNALVLGVGIAYSTAIKNAAKRLGKMFGAEVNRDEEVENVVVFSEKVVNKDEFNFKYLSKLLSEKEEKISSSDYKIVAEVLEKKQSKIYTRYIKHLEKL